ncbi:hypothetical protein E2C01_060033 [Portunus trituberculatus]|uniref:Uncharacterized protein n=1 Tax=Portunus trituberculatus TaxID=210409 RepID=A0A5B7H878_PORTR|nr:hypothetical protein [Portunus trituberculatus]
MSARFHEHFSAIVQCLSLSRTLVRHWAYLDSVHGLYCDFLVPGDHLAVTSRICRVAANGLNLISLWRMMLQRAVWLPHSEGRDC